MGYIGAILGYIGFHRGSIRTMENKMETTIMGYLGTIGSECSKIFQALSSTLLFHSHSGSCQIEFGPLAAH